MISSDLRPTAPRISTIVFDIGGVLVFNDNAKLLAALTSDMEPDVSHSELLSFIRTSGIGIGSATVADLHAAAVRKFGYRQPLEAFLAAWCCHFTPNPTTIDLLKTLSPKFNTAICSNTNGVHWQHLDRVYGLGGFVREAVLSHECGFEKPDDRIFDKVREQLGVTAQECLFVDDLAENVEAAAHLGFNPHHYVGTNAAADLAAKIRSLG